MEPEDELARRVIELLAQIIGREASTIRLTDALDDFDSLDICRFILEVEGEFDVDLHDPKLGKIQTVGELVEWVKTLL